MLFDLVRKLQKTEHIQVTMIYLICEKGKHRHVHLLMSGNGKYKGETISLATINCSTWERQWFSLTSSFATINKVNNQAKACRYVALHTFIKRCDDYELDFYNLKLLKKIEK